MTFTTRRMERRLLAPPGFPLPAGQKPLKKVAWFHPLELLRTGYHAWLSTIAKEYLDRREMLAALDATTVPVDAGLSKSVLITAAGNGNGRGNTFELAPAVERRGVLWIDFVADIGDSWEATYAVATLLARRCLMLRGTSKRTPAADIVVLGGDLVYPTPTREGYRYRLRWPWASAFPPTANPPHARAPAPCMLAIPGNHDWYDGLTNFVREFCQGGFLGGWRLVQQRSYFAVKLINGWWLWGIDIALDTRIDPPQQAYFRQILRRNDGEAGASADRVDKIILCTAKPCWLDDPRHSAEAYRNLVYFVKEIIEKNGGSTPIILAGDLHHYSRCEDRRGRQLIVSGGGGAYLTETHHLPQRVPELRSGTAKEPQSNKPEDAFVTSAFPYPSRTQSRRLALGALLLSFRPANWAFCLLAGILYWLFAWPLRLRMQLWTERFPTDDLQFLWTTFDSLSGLGLSVSLFGLAAIVGGSIAFAVGANRGNRWLRCAWGLAHGVAHLWLALAIAWLARPRAPVATHVASWLGLNERAVSYVFGLSLVLVGGLAAGTLLGVYLVVSDRAWGWHRNEVFAVQSIIDFRNFLRIKIERDGSLLIYPIGLRRVPRKWRARAMATGDGPCYEPADAVLEPHLIEGPIRVRG